MTTSIISTVYGTFTVNDNESGSISVSGPASASFGYPPTLEYVPVHAAALKGAIDFCLNYSQEVDTHDMKDDLRVLKIRGDNENIGIVIRDTCTPCGSVEGLTIHALKEAGKLDEVLKQIKTGETLEGLAKR